MYDERISIVMITHNRDAQIRIALKQLLQLPERPRLIVVDNGSTDGTVEAAQSLGARVVVLPLERNRGCAGRNAGITKAETPYVAFSDDDSWWGQDRCLMQRTSSKCIPPWNWLPQESWLDPVKSLTL